jgi:hypothetical protein
MRFASASRSSSEWNDDDHDVLADGVVVGRIMKATRSGGLPVGVGCSGRTPPPPGGHNREWVPPCYRRGHRSRRPQGHRSHHRRPTAIAGAPTHGYAATREGAMAGFARSWHREAP